MSSDPVMKAVIAEVEYQRDMGFTRAAELAKQIAELKWTLDKAVTDNALKDKRIAELELRLAEIEQPEPIVIDGEVLADAA